MTKNKTHNTKSYTVRPMFGRALYAHSTETQLKQQHQCVICRERFSNDAEIDFD